MPMDPRSAFRAGPSSDSVPFVRPRRGWTLARKLYPCLDARRHVPAAHNVFTMGIFSNWFSGSSSSAGKIETIKTASAGPAAASGTGKPNVWRSVFDPGSNPNIDRVGSAYYDTVHKVRGPGYFVPVW